MPRSSSTSCSLEVVTVAVRFGFLKLRKEPSLRAAEHPKSPRRLGQLVPPLGRQPHGLSLELVHAHPSLLAHLGLPPHEELTLFLERPLFGGGEVHIAHV